uniref:Uncharacterized protein n=1 Tax=Salmo trutta TaxID=8032 RepID=A0A674AFQ4_SALTR
MVPVGHSSKLEHNTSMPLMSVNPIISVLILSSSFAVHKLITYSFHHKTVTQLLFSIGSVDTVWFLLMFQLLSISTGVLYTLLRLVLFGASAQNQVEGLVPVSLSLMGMATVYSLMVEGFLFGVSVPMLALAVSGHLIMLYIMGCLVRKIYHHCVTHSPYLALGKHGKGWHPLLDMSDARASVLDKKMPFRLLRDNFGFRSISSVISPHSHWLQNHFYPVQAYAPVSSNLQATDTTPKTFEGWAHSYYTQGSPVQFSGYYGHNHGYALKHSFG